MPLGKEKQVVHIARLQNENPSVGALGFSIPIFEAEGIKSAGSLPTICHRPTI